MKITFFQIEDADLATVNALLKFVDGQQKSPEALFAFINGQRKQDASGPPNQNSNQPAEPQAAAKAEADKSQAKSELKHHYFDAAMYPSNPDEIVMLGEELLPVEMEVEVSSQPQKENNVLPKYQHQQYSPPTEMWEIADLTLDYLEAVAKKDVEEITASSDSE